MSHDRSELRLGGRLPDPRGIRVGLAPGAAADVPPIVLEPPAVPVAPAPRLAGSGLLGGTAPIEPFAPASAGGPVPPHAHGATASTPSTPSDHVLVDGDAVSVSLDRLDPERAILVRHGDAPTRTSVLLLPPEAVAGGHGAGARREVIIEGWRIEVDVEPAARAALRERARRGRADVGHSGPSEVHAIIPGVVVSVSVAPGDEVTAGQQLLVVEAMKMQNELRAPRDGRIERVAVAAGRTIEVGDLLLVIA